MLKTLFGPPLLAWLATTLLTCLAQAAQPVPSGPLIQGPIRFELAIYYSPSPATEPVAALRRRLTKLAGAPQLVSALPSKPQAALVQIQLNTTVQKDYRPPDLDMVQRFGRGLTRDQALALQRSERALILKFTHPAAQAIPAYRAALALSEQVARDTQGLLWDEETREIFTPDEWHARRLESWSGDTPDVLKHTVIHAYKSDQLVRAITLGMAKFGLPDVVVSNFSWSSNRPMGNLVNVLAQAMVEGAVIKTAGAYDLDLRAIRHTGVRESQLPTLKPNGTSVAKLTLTTGTWEQGDPNNRLVEMGFDRHPGPDIYARQEALLSAMFGSEDSITRIQHTNELLAASKAAQAKLPALQEAFNRGLQPGEFIMVKAPFPTPRGGNEWMWVEVIRWSGDTIGGLLKNEPADIPTLHAGQMVTVSQSKVFDYIRRPAKGPDEGNETGKILQQMQGSGK